MLTIIKKLKKSHSTGTDDIPMYFIKDLQQLLAPLLNHIFNLCIKKNNLYPTQLKIMKVIPILKKAKDPNLPLSYRPINLISVIS